MPITRIELPALWAAGININPQNGEISTTTVDDPLTPDTNIFAWSATLAGYGAILGFDHERMTKALRDDAGAVILLKFNFKTTTPGSANINTHPFTEAPEPYTDLPEIQGSAGVFIDYYGEGSGWSARDISPLMRALSGSDAGVSVLPAGMLDDAYEPTIELVGSWNPNRPTTEAPVGGIRKDRTQDLTFQWKHDGVFNQSQFEMRYRKKGTTAWTEIQEETNSQNFTLPANTLTAGEYEWQVRTTMKHEGETGTSQWSNIGIFEATEQTNAPNITRPAPGSIEPTTNLYIEWGAINNQEQVEVELRTPAGQTIRNATITTADNQTTMQGWLENNSEYIVRLRVLETDKFWSDWAEVNIEVMYTAPKKAIISFEKVEQSGAVIVTVNNPTPTGTEPAVTNQDLFRRERGETKWIKLAAALETNSNYTDYTLRAGAVYEYRVLTRGDNETSIYSDAQTTSISIKNAILSLTQNPEEYIELIFNPARSFSFNFAAEKMKFAGRKRPVTEFGEIIENDFTTDYEVSKEDMLKLQYIASKQETVLYRDKRGRKHFSTINSLSIQDDIRDLDRYPINMSLSEVDYQEGAD